jgi:hypothetical protein
MFVCDELVGIWEDVGAVVLSVFSITLEGAMKAQRANRCIDLVLIEEGEGSAPRLGHFTSGNDSVPIV